MKRSQTNTLIHQYTNTQIYKYTNTPLYKLLLLTIVLISLPLITSAKSIKIASYNVENLFDMQRSGLEYEAYLPQRHNWTESILQKKLVHLSEVICDLDADVIALQEVENDAALKGLQQMLKRVGCDYPYRAITVTKQTPIHNALLSRVPIRKKRDLTIYRRGKQRSILEAALDTEPPLRLFVNHWKSKSGPESERLPYAKALMQRIAKLPAGTEYLILGDFNSDYREFQVIDAKHNDTDGKTGINHLLHTIKDGRMLRLYDLQPGYHYNLWMELAPPNRWSHNFYGDKEAIDAILIPASMHNGRGWEYQQGSFGVFKPKYLFGKRGRIRRWEYSHGKHTGKGYSDHLPVYAYFVTAGEVSVEDRVSKGWMDRIRSFWSEITAVQRKPASPGDEKHRKRVSVNSTTIEALIEKEKLTHPYRLKGVKVIFKRGDSAVIKQEPQGRALLLYRCAAKLQEGYAYDITAHLKKRYKGLDELVDIAVEQKYGKLDPVPYILPFVPEMMAQKRYVNEVVQGIQGHYRGGKLIVEGKPMALYFKKGVKRPPEGSRIRITRAQIGYYKDHNELVVWDQQDYRILE